MKQFYDQPSSSNSTVAVPIEYAPSNEQAAWFAIAYTASCMNGAISNESREVFCKLITSKELYRGHEILDYYYEFMEVKDNFEPKEIIQKAAQLVNPEHAPTLFCIVTEILLAKGSFTEQEEDILEFIGKELGLDTETADKIREVLLLKYKWDFNFN
jgi:hypothetical protein